MSVVSSPLEVTNDFGVATMQEMTSEVCDAATDFDGDGEISAQLEDVRDGKYYWVSKLKDNKCWMTQNLDLDLSTSKTLTSADTDLGWNGSEYPSTPVNWTPGFTTAMEVDINSINTSNTGQNSWSLGDYRITKPTESNSCGSGKANLAACVDTDNGNDPRFALYATPEEANNDENAHYIVGNHYQWNAATAGTGGSIISGQATNSICPKGWKLPESNATTAGTFGGLLKAYSIANGDADSMMKLTSSPLYFVRGGFVGQNANELFYGAGDYGIDWSSTPNSDPSDYAYYLTFYSAIGIFPSNSYLRQRGYSVRCIAR